MTPDDVTLTSVFALCGLAGLGGVNEGFFVIVRPSPPPPPASTFVWPWPPPETALTYVYGIGNTSAKAIMAATGLENKRVRELSEEELTKLREEVEKYQIEGELRRFTTMNIKRLKEIQCHRGKMHIRNLPVRGQRTKTNARTRKGKVKTVAGKNK